MEKNFRLDRCPTIEVKVSLAATRTTVGALSLTVPANVTKAKEDNKV